MLRYVMLPLHAPIPVLAAHLSSCHLLYQSH